MRSAAGKLSRLLAQFGAMNLNDTIEPEKVEPFMQKKAALQEQIDLLRNEVQTAKAQRKDTPKHVTLGELPEAERFKQLGTQSKHLVDTLKMIAYRAETAMANSLREQDRLARPDEARSLLQVKVNHADEANEVFSTLMGDIVEHRRDFIQENALQVRNLDV